MSYGKLLIHRCDIYRHRDAKRGNFTKKLPGEKLYDDVHCRFIRKTAANTEVTGRTKVSAFYLLYLPKRIHVKNGDVIVWILDPDNKYKVQEPFSPSNRFNVVTIEKEGEA